MPEEHVSIEVDDEDKVIIAFERAEERADERVRNILDNLTDFGVHVLQANVPVHTEYLLRHIARGQVVGVGDEWHSIVGIKRGTSKHPLYVEFGTGIYGAVGWFITPLKGKFMAFYSNKLGRKIRVTHTKGQRPQHYFYLSWREMQIYSMARLMSADLLL